MYVGVAIYSECKAHFYMDAHGTSVSSSLHMHTCHGLLICLHRAFIRLEIIISIISNAEDYPRAVMNELLIQPPSLVATFLRLLLTY